MAFISWEFSLLLKHFSTLCSVASIWYQLGSNGPGMCGVTRLYLCHKVMFTCLGILPGSLRVL